MRNGFTSFLIIFNKRGKPVEIIPLETETFPPPEPEDLYKIIMRRKSYGE
jgi:hypothetical protein